MKNNDKKKVIIGLSYVALKIKNIKYKIQSKSKLDVAYLFICGVLTFIFVSN